jgi:hypothetical protein
MLTRLDDIREFPHSKFIYIKQLIIISLSIGAFTTMEKEERKFD